MLAYIHSFLHCNIYSMSHLPSFPLPNLANCRHPFIGPHQCSVANQNRTTQSHTILTPTGPFNLISLACLTTPTPCADNVGSQNVASLCTSTHTHTHTQLLSLIWSGAGHTNNFLGVGYTYVLITLLLQFMTIENYREGTNKHHTSHTTHAPTQVQSTSIPQ